MQEEKKVATKTVDPVVDQKITKNGRSKWLLWLLPLLLLLILFIWFAQRNTTNPQPESQADINSSPPHLSGHTTEADSGKSLDKITGWLNGDKKSDSGWITLDNISFRSGSADPIIDDSGQLGQIANILNSHPDTKVVIRGFADASGSQELNENLSSERANAVRAWLTEHNVSAKRLGIDAKGASAPVASNATEQGREMNRRVALKIFPGN